MPDKPRAPHLLLWPHIVPQNVGKQMDPRVSKFLINHQTTLQKFSAPRPHLSVPLPPFYLPAPSNPQALSWRAGHERGKGSQMSHGWESSLELQAGWDASNRDHQPHRELGLGHNSAFCRIQGPWPPTGSGVCLRYV